jgi:hypothetical protein
MGGSTRPANLASAGKRDHQLKTDRLVAVGGDANGRLTVTTPAGREYPSDPYLHACPSAGVPPPF